MPVYDRESVTRHVIWLSADDEIDHVVNGYYMTCRPYKWKFIEPAEEQVFPQHTENISHVQVSWRCQIIFFIIVDAGVFIVFLLIYH